MTIFALSTPPGKSGVAVLRVSGVGALASLRALGVSTLPVPRVATLAALRAEGSIIDQALVLYFAAPNSFTGEDVVEYHIHGSRAVIARLLGVFATLPGLRPAEPGEFTRRAFLNGKMDLTAAEGLADLIDAETEAQRCQAVRLMQGEAAVFYGQLRADVLHALAYLEAYIDFPDEDIQPQVLSEIDDKIQGIVGIIDRMLAASPVAEKIREGIHIAILGPPNVGKSSLMNLLAKRDVAIVSSHAGTTRDVIEVHLDIAGYSVIIADTAGIREHCDEIEQEGIRRSFARAELADLKIVMFDAQSFTSSGVESFRELVDESTLLLVNKSDVALPSSPALLKKEPVVISVKERTGIEALLLLLATKIQGHYPSESSLITRARHRTHLQDALAHLRSYSQLQTAGLEIRCEELRRSAAEIGNITGKITVDEVLGRIFGSFCIGK